MVLFIYCSAITLDIIRSKLDPINPDRYRDVSSFIDDIRLLFENVYLFYRVSAVSKILLLVTACYHQIHLKSSAKY